MQPIDDQEKVRMILAACLEEAEASFDQLIEDLCTAHPGLANAIRETLGSGPPHWEDPPYVSLAREELGSVANVTPPHLGPYRPVAELGRGGQGTVYLASDSERNRSVAIKVLDASASSSPELIEHIQRALSITCRLDHPGTCTIWDAGTFDDTIYLVMPFIEGETLASTIRQQRESASLEPQVPASPSHDRNATFTTKHLRNRLDLPFLLELFEGAARALHSAHEAGVLHGDIKPGNLMVTPSGEPVWLDFALTLPGGDARRASPPVPCLARTTAYLSPELVAPGRVCPDPRSDLFSLAVTLFEAITLTKPFQAPTRESLLQSIRRDPHPKLRRMVPDAPRTLESVLNKALEKKPRRRYANAQEFADELRRIRERRPVRARPVSLMGQCLRWAERRPHRALSFGLMTIVLFVVLGLAGYTLAVWSEIRDSREREHRAELELQLTEAYEELCTADPRVAWEAFESILREDPALPAAIAGKAFALFLAGERSACLAWLRSNDRELHSLEALRRLRESTIEALGCDDQSWGPNPPAEGQLSSSLDSFLESVRLMLTKGPQVQGVLRDALLCSRRSILLTKAPRMIYHAQLAYLARVTMDSRLGEEVACALEELWPGSPLAGRIAEYATTLPFKRVR